MVVRYGQIREVQTSGDTVVEEITAIRDYKPQHRTRYITERTRVAGMDDVKVCVASILHECERNGWREVDISIKRSGATGEIKEVVRTVME